MIVYVGGAGLTTVTVWTWCSVAGRADRPLRGRQRRRAVPTADEHAEAATLATPATPATLAVEQADDLLGPDSLLTLTRDLLDVELALLTEVQDDRETVVRAAGSWPGIDISQLPGSSLALRDTFCERLLEGSLPPYIGDVDRDPKAADLMQARAYGVKSWIGARVDTSGPELYVLCCLARESQPALGPRQVQTINAMATSIGRQLETSAS